MIELAVTVVFVLLMIGAVFVWALRDHAADDRPVTLERPSSSRIPD